MRLEDVIAAGDAWLTQRIIHYAKDLDYTPFTSTLEEAWLASVRGLSASMLKALEEGQPSAGVRAQADYAHDPIALYGIEAAQRHRTRGITLGLFLGLMKSYRRAYVDLVATVDVPAAERAGWHGLIDNFFDRMEVGFCSEWAGRTAGERCEELARQNRLITNEKNKYLTVFESLHDPVILVAPGGAVENMNLAASALFLQADAPGVGYYGSRHVAIVDVLGFDPTAPDATAGGHERDIDTAAGRRTFDIRTRPMLDVSEKFLGTVVILIDITEYRLAKEDAQRADRAKSSFLATMSHEIRTPIHGILGLAELLGERPLPPQERRWVEAIARSGEILSSVVADILDYTKIEAGVLDVEEIDYSVDAVVEDVFGLMLPLARRKPDLELVFEAPRLPRLVGDPGKLRQILLNLVGNAIKFTEEGKVWLTVETVGRGGEAADGPDGATPTELRFVVADTGIGIAADRLGRIFEPFAQSDSSVARRFGGTGLGLAICRSLVERLGGAIGVESRVDGGSRFWFTVPFVPWLAGAATDGGAGPAARPLGPLDVLVVEDNEVNAMVARGLLEQAGHRVVIAAAGLAAIDCVLAARFDVVLMDLRLPDIDGLETTRRIRALADPTKARVPIVALSAQLLKSDVEACLAAGMNDFLGKPFHFDRLAATLGRVLSAAPAVAPEPAVEMPPTPVRVPIDARVLEEHIAALGRDQTGRIVATYLAGTRALAGELDRIGDDDTARLGEIAHRLKSSSLHVGLRQLSAAAEEIEQAVRAGGGVPGRSTVRLAAECRAAFGVLEWTWRRLADGAAETAPARAPAAAQPAKT
jgi:signal transduction histidine kinase/DNA-binding response OmpR family regulator